MALLDFSKKWTLIMGTSDEATRFAALELRDVLFKISKEMPILAEQGSSAQSETIFLMNDGGERDGFSWRASPSRIELWGDSPRGLLNAVYDFLHELGCRWLFPGIMGELLPDKGILELKNEGRREIPDFGLRAIALSHALHFTQDWVLWASRNGFNAVLFLTGGSSDHTDSIPEKRYEAYRYLIVSLARRCGMRVEHGTRVKAISPEARAEWPAQMRSYFIDHPEVDAFHLWAQESAGEAFPGLALEAALLLAEVKPRARLILRFEGSPPPDPSSYPDNMSLLSSEPDHAARAWITDRFDTNAQGFSPQPAFEESRAEVERARGLGIKEAYFLVSGNRPWIGLQPHPWLFSRFIRKEPADTEFLLLDFLDKAYGPAAIALKCYYRFLNDAFNADFTDEKSDFKPFVDAEDSLQRAQEALTLYEAESSTNVVKRYFEEGAAVKAGEGASRVKFYDLPFCQIHLGLLRAEHELTEAVFEYEAIRRTVSCLSRDIAPASLFRLYSLAALVAAGKMRKWAQRYLSDARTKKAFLYFLYVRYVALARSFRDESFRTGIVRAAVKTRGQLSLRIRTRRVRNIFNP